MSKTYGSVSLDGWLAAAVDGQGDLESLKVSDLLQLSKDVAAEREAIHQRYGAEIDAVVALQERLHAVAKGLKL